MTFLPNNNTAFKRRLIKEDPVEEEEEDDCLFENQESENLSEIQVQAKQTSGFMHDASVEHLKFQPASSLVLLKAMSLKVRPSTAAAYRKSSKEWQVSVDLSKYVGTRSIVFMFYCHSNWEDFCGENRHRYSVDFRLPLTVEPTEFVLAYFKESVLKRTYKKSISIETNVRTQIALRNDENEKSELTLLEIAENAPSNKNSSKGVIDIPLGVEAVN
ncbi:hypothetical protein HMPREF1544_09041 [Mucor circinelloides 1006PhL]|uniref:Uncharacterized protein n=1 Tax=Mucor circinelloides f. circinelloides (strain 1006PhL) TaxID=1220926 RepID=S2JNJ3_MUCC1|nr:hypothetical protein HMPREF1544_09041 [Mucor circinelloides 1006PhL]